MFRPYRLVALLFSIILCAPVSVLAQAREYRYESIVVNADVHADSTVLIREEQTYRFTGSYHQGYRSIPHKALGAITDVRVIDKVTGKELKHSPRSLDLNDPASWGKYTYYEEEGETIIEWYFDLADTSHVWDLEYVVHGAIGFYRDHDELYWNLFTNYDVPVDLVQAIVTLPGAVTKPTYTFYTEPELPYVQNQYDDRSFMFTVVDVPPQTKLTFAVGWQKGLVSQWEYWKDFLRINSVYVLALLIVLASLVFALMYEFLHRRRVHGKGTIIPQYEPPEHLAPAEAVLIVKRKLTPQAWSATVVDLAVRGYLTIEESKKKQRLFGILYVLISILVGAVIAIALSDEGLDLWGILFVVGIVGIFFILSLISSVKDLWKKSFDQLISTSDFVIRRTEKPDKDLKEYEREYLKALSPRGGEFSTARLKSDRSASQALHRRVSEVEELLKNTIQAATQAFERPPFTFSRFGITPDFDKKALTWQNVVAVCACFFGAIFLMIGAALLPGDGVLWVVGALVFAAFVVLYELFLKARLNTRGEILKEEWLGFKLYLEKAEQYRMQNLTPETFEKYLPYAIIFGVEKEWGKAFSSIAMQPPSWYHGAVSSGPGSSASASGFSASAFSASFSSSFSSAFSSAGGGGASGGGGSAGGGGGGGGGGAR